MAKKSLSENVNAFVEKHGNIYGGKSYQELKEEQRIGMSGIPTNHSASAKTAQVELIGNPEHFNFTKGEWIAERESENQICHLIKTGEKYTIHIYDSKYGIDEQESWANAVLISKAPELLRMLKKVTNELEYYAGNIIIKHPIIEKSRKLIKEIEQ